MNLSSIVQTIKLLESQQCAGSLNLEFPLPDIVNDLQNIQAFYYHTFPASSPAVKQDFRREVTDFYNAVDNMLTTHYEDLSEEDIDTLLEVKAETLKIKDTLAILNANSSATENDAD